MPDINSSDSTPKLKPDTALDKQVQNLPCCRYTIPEWHRANQSEAIAGDVVRSVSSF